MNVRMGGRMKITMDAPAHVQELAFPPLVLISLVENAVRHGLEPKSGHGSICVRARCEGNALEVVVEDDGVGLSAGLGGGGIGLSNVRSQLQNRFGRDASFEVCARQPGGVIATIRIPHRQ